MEKFNFQFYEWEKKTPNKPFLKQPFGDKWETYTWAETGQMVRKLATGLKSLGLPEKSQIGLVAKNCREWVITDLAIMMAGYVSIPFYPTLKADAIKELIEIADVKAVFAGKVEDWKSMKAGIPAGMPLIKFPHYEGFSTITEGENWFEFIEKHKPMKGEPSPDLDDLWTIVFTSGTTGTPKGVVMDYRALASTKRVLVENNHLKISETGDNRFFSFLPLNHIAERAVIESNCLFWGGSISFAESLETFAKNLQDTQPTLFFAVPRLWTKFKLGILAKIPEKRLDLLLKLPIIKGVIKKKLKAGLGLTHVRGCLTGAASIPEETKNFFRRLDIPIAEAYGMTENAGCCTCLEASQIKPLSVGKPWWGCDLKLDEGTNEILMKAPYMMKEYYKAPEITAKTIRNGWLHTGDEGRIDKDGFLYITGRVKDTFKTTKGKFIIPSPIEWHFAQDNNIEQICLMGLGCPQPVALVVLSEIGLAESKAAVKESLTNTLKYVNSKVKAHEKVSTIIVVKEAWSVENELLTPTMKVKRNVIGQRYNNLLLDWHKDKEGVLFE